MRFVIATDTGDHAGRIATGAPRVVRVGRCPLCGDALHVRLPREGEPDDADAVCTACAGIVGRVYAHARLTRDGIVSTRT